MKIKRDAFLYLEGKDNHFAQCRGCVFGPNTCGIMNGEKVSPIDGSCGFFIKGLAVKDKMIATMSKKQTGYVERQVRCENCKFFASGECNLFHKLNGMFPELFDLDVNVHRFGCCNAQVAK